jgi:hypothetical protein
MARSACVMSADQKRVSLVPRQFVALPRDLQIKVLVEAAHAYATCIPIEKGQTSKGAT